MPYNPKPTRAWSRVQSQCTFINNDSSYNAIYIPLINKTLPPGEALYYDKLQYKGNILQYKGNSIGLTKRQKYAQIFIFNLPRAASSKVDSISELHVVGYIWMAL